MTKNILEHDHAIIDQPRKHQCKTPKIIVLIEPPMELAISRQTSMERGTESSTATVARGLPRKIRIIMPVSTSPIAASLVTLLIASFTKTDWSNTTAVFNDAGMSTDA